MKIFGKRVLLTNQHALIDTALQF